MSAITSALPLPASGRVPLTLRVFAALELAQIRVVDADALGHAADGVARVLGGKRLSALFDVTSEGAHVSIMR